MIDDIAHETLELALKNVDDVEIYVEKEGSVDVDIQKDKVDFAKEVSALGIGVRVIIDGKVGFSYTTNVDNLKYVVEKAIFNAKSNIKDGNFSFAMKSKYPTVKGIYDKKIQSLDVENAVEFAKMMIDTVKDEKCEPTSGGFSAAYNENYLVNSNDIHCKDISTMFSGFIAINAEKNGEIATASESDSSRHFDIDPNWIARKACEIAKDSLNGKPAETKDMNVILDYHAAGGLLATFVNALNADNVQRGRSIFADKIDQKIVSTSLSMYDDGTLQKGLNSSTVDGEGTPSQKTTIIEKGVLKNFIYDIYTANKGNVESTGNGMRASFSDTPSVDLSNFILEFEDILEISDVTEGIIVTDVLGAHTSNPISGDFSVEAHNAFKIENGEITSPIKKAMLSGNIFTSMNNSSAISEKTRQLGPFVIPRILIDSLRVVG